MRHNNNNKCQHRHIIVQQNVIFSILVSPHNQQSFSFKIFSRAKVGKIQSCHQGKTEQQRSNLQMREILLEGEKKLLLQRNPEYFLCKIPLVTI